MYPALDVARYFIAMTDGDSGEGLTNLKLQKLLYYAQGTHLALTGTPLFPEDVEAWLHGPVVPQVYQRFKPHGTNAIPASGCGGFPAIDDATCEILDDVYNVFGQFSGWKLRQMIEVEPPWKETRPGEVISHAKLRDYFQTQVTHHEEGPAQEALAAGRETP